MAEVSFEDTQRALRMRCPHPDCNHQWTRRTARPVECPNCKRMLAQMRRAVQRSERKAAKQAVAE